VSRASDQRPANFVRYYCEGKSGTEAARLAGYASKSAHVAASRLLRKDKIRAAIEAFNRAATEAAGITVARTLAHLGFIAYADPRALLDADGNFRPIKDLSEAEAAQIAGIDLETTFTKGDDGDSERPGAVTTTVRKIRRYDKNVALRTCVDVLGLNRPTDPAASGGLQITFVPWSQAKRRSTKRASLPAWPMRAAPDVPQEADP